MCRRWAEGEELCDVPCATILLTPELSRFEGMGAKLSARTVFPLPPGEGSF
jgi:hypothetical protein